MAANSNTTSVTSARASKLLSTRRIGANPTRNRTKIWETLSRASMKAARFGVDTNVAANIWTRSGNKQADQLWLVPPRPIFPQEYSLLLQDSLYSVTPGAHRTVQT